MDMTIDQQVALDEALVPHASRLRIRKSNFRLKSDISSKESTLQLVYDVLRLTPFYKAFLVTADVPEIYMQELWATATIHHHSILFKMDNKKHIVNLEYFREMHNEEIRRLTDVNINKLHQPWRSFAAIINKCLSGKSTGYDSLRLRLSQAQILWGLYHKRNVDFAYLLYEDFIYQVEHKDAKKSNEMYYPRFTKFGAMLPIELTNEDIKNSEAYKEYYAVAIGAAPPKTKASVRKKKNSSDTTVTPPTTAAGSRLSTSAKGKQPAKASKAKSLIVLSEVAMTKAEQLKLATKRSLQQTHISQASGSGADEGTGIIPGVPDVPTEESDEEISWKSSDEEDNDDVDEGSDDQEDDDAQDDDDDQDDDNQGDDDQDEGDDDDDQDKGNEDDQDSNEEGKEFIHPKLSIHDEEETKDKESFDPIAKMPENSDDEGNDEENLSLNVGREEGKDEEDDKDELYRDVNINLEGRVVQMENVHTTQEFEDTRVTLTLVNPDGIDSIFEITSQMDVQVPTTVAPFTLSAPTLTPSTVATISIVPQAPTPLTTTLSTLLQDLPNFGLLFGLDHRLKTLEANFSEFMQTNQFAEAVFSILGIVQRYMDQQMNEAVKIIKEQIKEQVKVQVSKILLKIEKTVNEKLEVKVLTRSSNSSKTSYAAVADLSEMELKKILIEKMEGNKSIHRSDEQRNLYKALVEAYESDKIILDTYGDTVTLKRRHDDDDVDKDQEPSSGSDRGSKRGRERKKPESISAPKQTTHDLEEPSNQEFESGAADDQPIAETSQHPEWFSLQKKPPTLDYTLTLELLAVPTYELMKGSCKSLVELEFFLEEVYKATTDQQDWINPEGHQYPHNLLKPLPLIPNFRGRRVSHLITSSTTTLSIYVEVPQVASTQLLSPRQRQQIMGTSGSLLAMSTLNEESSLSLNLRLSSGTITSTWIGSRMFTRSIVIQRRVEDLQLGVESYQKKVNLTRPDTYRSDLKRKEAYTAYSNPRGFIYQNKDKQNRLMRINELHKLSDGMLNDVRTALDDRIKAKDEKDHEKLEEVCWWETVRGRLLDALTDHMIHHMMSLSFKDDILNTLKSIKPLDEFSSNIASCAQLKDRKLIEMKSYDCHMLMQEYLPIALRGNIPDHVTSTILDLCNFFRIICYKDLNEFDLKFLKSHIAITLCKLEKMFPLSFFIVMEHLVIHLVKEVRLGGPESFRWMYPIKRDLLTLKSYVHNRAHPEGSITQDIIELNYSGKIRVVLFRGEWVDINRGCKKDKYGTTLVNFSHLSHSGANLSDDSFVFGSQVDKVFYYKDPKKKVMTRFNASHLHRIEDDGDDREDVTSDMEHDRTDDEKDNVE
nr:hypothetical protein [Tanacetum cinerariifolium]